MTPFDLSGIAGTFGYALLFGAIGFAFGAVLEMVGFGDTRKLAAQFYLRDMTVLKTMFTGITVAAVLVFLAAAFGLLDFSRVWVNPTYLWPGIVGGLVMGVGFVVGGFCPGTSLVAAATLKVDGILFVLGALFGVWAFGESVSSFEPFFLSSDMGRFTIPEWLGLPVGATVLLVALMALGVFWGAEVLERRFATSQPAPAAAAVRRAPRAMRLAGAGALVLACLVLVARGQPSAEQKWRWAGEAAQRLVDQRAIFVHPAEVVALKGDTNLKVQMMDLRDEHEFNLFHIGEARRVAPADLERPPELKRLLDQPATSVTFLVSNGEQTALAVWKRLKGQGVNNVYVVEGGVNRWLELYPVPACVARKASDAAGDAPGYRFAYATGASLPSAWPELPRSQEFRFPCGQEMVSDAEATWRREGFRWPAYTFTKRVKLRAKTVVKGGCG